MWVRGRMKTWFLVLLLQRRASTYRMGSIIIPFPPYPVAVLHITIYTLLVKVRPGTILPSSVASFGHIPLVAQMVKCLPAIQETRVGKIPWRRKWQATPALLPGKSHGRRSLIVYSPWGRKVFCFLSTKCINWILISRNMSALKLYFLAMQVLF